MLKRGLIVLLGLLLLLLGGLTAAYFVYDAPVPEGHRGPAADALARRVQDAVQLDGWRATGAVRWSFAGKHRLLWDRARGLVEVRWQENRVLLRLSDRSGVVFHSGMRVSDRQRELDQAYRYFINDSFWLNPFDKLFDPGVVRSVVETEGGRDGLLVRFTQGGVTPGDAYLLSLDESGLPYQWEMWVEIIPLGGLAATWERWQTLPTGAKISTLHEIGPRAIVIGDLQGATQLAELLGEGEPDPFAPLLRQRDTHHKD